MMIWDRATNVMIGAELQLSKGENGVTIGFRRVRLVTAAGRAWDKSFLPFGLTIAGVVADWNLKQLETWTPAS